jgi:hypothetical protein
MVSRTPYFILFALSGFAGLIYESIWSQYLKLFLDHAAYTQALASGSTAIIVCNPDAGL